MVLAFGFPVAAVWSFQTCPELAGAGRSTADTVWDASSRRAARGGQRTGKTDCSHCHGALAGGFQHEPAHEVIDEKMHPKFPLQGPVALSPDGTTLVAGGGDGAVKLLDLNTRKERATLKGHAGPVLSLAFSKDGKLLVSGGVDQTVRLWRAASDEEVAAANVSSIATAEKAGPQ